MPQHDFVMLRHAKSQHLDRHRMLWHKRIMPRHIALEFLCETGSCRCMPRHAHQHSPFSAYLILFCLPFHLFAQVSPTR